MILIILALITTLFIVIPLSVLIVGSILFILEQTLDVGYKETNND